MHRQNWTLWIALPDREHPRHRGAGGLRWWGAGRREIRCLRRNPVGTDRSASLGGLSMAIFETQGPRALGEALTSGTPTFAPHTLEHPGFPHSVERCFVQKVQELTR